MISPRPQASLRPAAASPEIRKWRSNLVTRYDFRQGFLRGVNIGGAIRWRDKIGIGYPFVTNATDELVPIAANADGSWGTFRVPPERSWSVTNSLAF